MDARRDFTEANEGNEERSKAFIVAPRVRMSFVGSDYRASPLPPSFVAVVYPTDCSVSENINPTAAMSARSGRRFPRNSEGRRCFCPLPPAPLHRPTMWSYGPRGRQPFHRRPKILLSHSLT